MKAHYHGLSTVRVALLGIFLFLCISGPAFASDDGYRIAVSDDIPGKFGWTTCEVFAQELYRRLTHAGAESYFITFSWQNPSGMTGNHAIVVFRDQGGDYWGMDARAKRPIRISGHSPAAWARSYCQGFAVHIASVVTDSRLKGQYADLNRTSEARGVPVVAKEEKPVRPKRVGQSSRKKVHHTEEVVLVGMQFHDGLTPPLDIVTNIANRASNLEAELALVDKPFWSIIVDNDKNQQKKFLLSMTRERNFLELKLSAFWKSFSSFEKERFVQTPTLWLPQDIASNSDFTSFAWGSLFRIASLI